MGAAEKDRSALVDRLRKVREARARGARVAAPPKPVGGKPTKAFDFSTLPIFEQMRFQEAVGQTLGIGTPFFREIEDRAGALCVIDGEERINFASYDYLGLGGHPDVRRAAVKAAEKWGVSANASRLVGGERPYHGELERALAEAYGVEAAVAMVSGHATNVTTIGAMLGPKDLILMDQLIHNSISEGARLSGAARLTFPHNDFEWVDETLSRVRGRYERVLVVVEGLYSMDGDLPDLARFVEVKARHDAWLMVDEAHAFGVLGETGRGIAELQGVDPKTIEIWMGTLSKTLVSCGGYICGSEALIAYLKHKAPGFVFSVGIPAPVAATATAAVKAMLAEPERVARLRANGLRFRDRAKAAGLDIGLTEGYAVTPVIIGDSPRAVVAADRIFQRGVNALPIIFPAVPEQQARIRFFLTADHTEEQIDRAVDVTAEVVRELEDVDLFASLRG
ncbi:aminotransferase class I/II-fold pyridoxal phosphate-dependent enzyme [Pikeienuella piscinae]|uniref:Aminotransferase class I/II-fold pyridoxal phosphate-dependent enzyme n=1 Tax=Pikeienuella piscinae TaxID=2748098 RepID=A0A7L5BUA1_9RHOB|nr:aminotransferase class I/II-fold pyridoxal phosphate-dependent enzyme [Pikeienuella piscinae]QIE55820.1 aminotransferase class I/II-fold pyridoxal phosphate-dependent enzyme [Pikeienuella piscinae]